MTKGAQLRMTKASFPQELRLQVMRASVQYHSSTFRISSTEADEDLAKDLKDAATSLFDTEHTFGALYDTLKKLADQAFFEAAIFNVFTSFSLSREGSTYSTGPDFDKIAERVQHLELDILIPPELGWEATLENATSLWTSVRLRSPKLKACVLTVVVQTFHQESSGDDFALGYYGTHDRDPFPKDILSTEPTPGQYLSNTLAKLFAEFAKKGLGVRRFVRIQHFQCEDVAEKATPHFGPLVAVQSARFKADAHGSPCGTSMLTEAYQFARSGEKASHTFRSG
jgi:hypothetical protein